MRALLLPVLVLLLMAMAPGTGVAAQGCDDCRVIKQELRELTPRATLPTVTAAPTAVVRAVLYWVDGCGHCEEVLNGILPQMQQKYGSRLEVRLVEVVSTEDIAEFYAVAERYGFAKGKAEVPFLLIGEQAVSGADQITAELPPLIELHLGKGGVDWPTLDESPGASPATTDQAGEGCAFTAPCAETPTAVAAGTGESGQAASARSNAVTGWPVLLAAGGIATGALVLASWGIWRRRSNR
jgi:hypothetical protein